MKNRNFKRIGNKRIKVNKRIKKRQLKEDIFSKIGMETIKVEKGDKLILKFNSDNIKRPVMAKIAKAIERALGVEVIVIFKDMDITKLHIEE